MVVLASSAVDLAISRRSWWAVVQLKVRPVSPGRYFRYHLIGQPIDGRGSTQQCLFALTGCTIGPGRQSAYRACSGHHKSILLSQGGCLYDEKSAPEKFRR